MGKIYYYYDPVVRSNCKHYGRYSVSYYCTDGKKSEWAGSICEDSPTAALEKVRKLIDELNKPRGLFESLEQWWWFYMGDN